MSEDNKKPFPYESYTDMCKKREIELQKYNDFFGIIELEEEDNDTERYINNFGTY